MCNVVFLLLRLLLRLRLITVIGSIATGIAILRMPRRIRIHQRLVVAVRVQVQTQGIVPVTGKGIFLHETRRDRVVHACIQVVEPCLRIVLVSGVEDVVRKDASLIQDVSKCIVVVRGDDATCGV